MPWRRRALPIALLAASLGCVSATATIEDLEQQSLVTRIAPARLGTSSVAGDELELVMLDGRRTRYRRFAFELRDAALVITDARASVRAPLSEIDTLEMVRRFEVDTRTADGSAVTYIWGIVCSVLVLIPALLLLDSD